MEKYEEAFMTRIWQLRNSKNMTGTELGYALGVGKVAVSQWENGKNFPSKAVLIKIADFFHVSLDYLMGRPSQSTSPISLEDFINNFLVGFEDEQKRTIIDLIEMYRSKNALNLSKKNSILPLQEKK